LGFSSVQLSATQSGLRPRDLDQSARRDLLATLRRLELELAGVDLWIPPAHFLEAVHIDRAVGAMLSAIEFAADLGRVPVSVALPHEINDEILEAISEAAHRHGAPIADHAIPTADSQRPQADSELLSVGIDPASWLAAGLDPSEGVVRAGDALQSARLCDLSSTGLRAPVGESDGRLDVHAYRASLSVAGYRRPIVVDARQWADPWRGVERTAEMWNGM
jgi:sugar phosphate isomerase/epimerase